MSNSGNQPVEPIASIEVWDGQWLGNGPLALVPRSGSTPGSSDFNWLVASDETHVLEVPTDRIAPFLQAHRQTVILARNAAALCWAIHDHLQAGNEHAQQGLWDQARAGCIHDSELIRHYLADLRGTGFFTIGNDGGPSPEPEDPRSILAAFLAQCRQLTRRLDRSNPDATSPNPEVFAILASRVRGRIALQRPNRTGLRLRRDQIPVIRDQFREIFDAACKNLQQDEGVRKAFKWENERVRCTTLGFPRQDNKKLRAWLESEIESARDLFDCPPARTWDSNGQLSTRPEDWAALAQSRPLVQHWRQLAATGVALACLDEQAGLPEPRLRSEFEVFPRLSAQKPDLGLLRQFVDEPFLEADPGTVLVVGQLRDLGVRCRVELGERQVGHPIPLGDLIREGDEQVAQGQKRVDQGQVLVNQGYDVTSGKAFIAEGTNLIGRGRAYLAVELADQLGRQILNLAPQRWNDGEEPEFRRGIIRRLLKAALESLGTEGVRQVLAEEADWSLSCAQAAELYGEFLVVIGDLGWFASEAWRWAYYRDATPAADGTGAVVHPVIQEFWEHWDGRQGQPTVGGISRSFCAWPRNRPTGYDFHQTVFDEILTDTLFELVACPFDVVDWAGDRFVVRVAAVDPPFQEIATIAQTTAQRHLKHLSVPCDVELVEAW